MKTNFSDMYNSLTSSRRQHLPYTIPPAPPFLLSTCLPLNENPPPPPPPPLFLLDSRAAPLLPDLPPPPLPPPFVSSPFPEPLPPVFDPGSFYSDDSDLPEWTYSKQECLPQQNLNEPWPSVRPKRAYTEGSHSSLDFSRLCEQLTQSQNQKCQLGQRITQLETYIAQLSHHERDLDFNQDKCLDNAERKLKKNKVLLDKIKNQISTLEAQIPPEKGFPLYYPLPTPSPKDLEKNRSSKKKPKLFTILKNRAKTWPFS